MASAHCPFITTMFQLVETPLLVALSLYYHRFQLVETLFLVTLSLYYHHVSAGGDPLPGGGGEDPGREVHPPDGDHL